MSVIYLTQNSDKNFQDGIHTGDNPYYCKPNGNRFAYDLNLLC